MSIAHHDHHADDQAVHSDQQEILEICNSVASISPSLSHSPSSIPPSSDLNSDHLTCQSITSPCTSLPVIKADR